MKLIKRLTAVICLICMLLAAAGAEGHYSFRTHVTPTIMDEIMGEKKQKAYFSMIDAVLEGKTEFDCPDEETYDWTVVQYPYRCFPVIAEYVTMPMNGSGWKNGKGRIEYKIPVDEFMEKLEEFKTQVTGILNEVFEDDYSDIEKALALYIYFANHYTYDYDTYSVMQTQYVENLSAYRLSQTGTGICQEVSVWYSYLLMQAGVDATIVMGGDHQWSYVTINGKNWHIDPTYVLDNDGSLSWFMMTDEKRYVEGAYSKDDYTFSSCYAQFTQTADYTAEDRTYAELWDKTFVSMDAANNVIYYTDCDGNAGSFTYAD